jgi:hypothetical protein
MADELSISEATVRTHVKNILERLGAKNRAHAVALAMGTGLLSDEQEQEISVARIGRADDADAVGAVAGNGRPGWPDALKPPSGSAVSG